MWHDKVHLTADIDLDDVRASLRQLLQQAATPTEPARPAASAGGGTSLVGEVMDTHHPDLPGRVFVQWLSETGQSCEQWLACVRGAAANRGDRVLLEQPANWPEKLVTGVLITDQEASARPAEAVAQTLELPHDQCVRITDDAQRPLLEVYASSQGPVVRLLGDALTLEAPKTLKLQAETLELQAGRGGVDIRTEADTVVRSRYIRLN
ncbi:hypothetical protein [Caldimonas brevitalea]|uniref:Uncharacterized protein n=1 Tax=Caldimonas brevitalea TaxID=413882 RepID=A0A0G3BN85_9BURK|nr:hypothetical protein [Caldimonas brevitalea]AKJ30914.1 hypothetical protein AAW51_4223 [Caldimonas brevitalea]